jgi:hypothetical protein
LLFLIPVDLSVDGNRLPQVDGVQPKSALMLPEPSISQFPCNRKRAQLLIVKAIDENRETSFDLLRYPI